LQDEVEDVVEAAAEVMEMGDGEEVIARKEEGRS